MAGRADSLSEDDDEVRVPGSRVNGATSAAATREGARSGPQRERWEDVQRSWEQVEEGADGNIANAVEELVEADKRRRLLRDTTPIQRGIIRHLILLLDLSASTAEKDHRPNRYLLSLRETARFVTRFFEQNPISQLAFVGTRDGLAFRISDLSGNPAAHVAALQRLMAETPDTASTFPTGGAGGGAGSSTSTGGGPRGSPSLQNGLELARAGLVAAPSHGTREVVVVWGSLLTADPGDIHKTIASLVDDRVRVSVVGLASGRLAICSELVARTHNLPPKADTARPGMNLYAVALDEAHFRDLLMGYTTPPPTTSTTTTAAPATRPAAPALLPMGFPSRATEEHPSLCACHARPSQGGYFCPRCSAKACGLPGRCAVCGLQLVQSTHLARSWHHLFPLRNYVEVSWGEVRRGGKGGRCFGCLVDFPAVPVAEGDADGEGFGGGEGTSAGAVGVKQQQQQQQKSLKGASESSRYGCASCGEHFCIDCDVFNHDVLHNCAGCLGKA